MATADLPLKPQAAAGRRVATSTAETNVVRELLSVVASLRVTVVLIALSVFLVFAGTLAQRFYDVWYPVNHMFRSWYAPIELRYFLPAADAAPGDILRFPFFGGWSLGAMLGANLLAAHALRFKVTARGRRLVAGIVVLVAGVAAAYAMLRSGLENSLRSELSPAFANGLWHAYRATLGGGTLALAWVLATTWPRRERNQQKWLWWLGAVVASLLIALTAALFVRSDWRIDASGLRILWQLTKGLGVSLVLLAGCWLTFGRRAGVVLLHGGVALLMASELHTGLIAVESQMRIDEGQTVAYAEDMRAAELALVDKSDPATDRVTRVPQPLLEAAAGREGGEAIIDDERLPVLLRVLDFAPNSEIRWRQPSDDSPATTGWGQLRTIDKLPGSVGTDTEQTFDVAGAFVELLERGSRDSLGVFLFHPLLPPQVVETAAGDRYEAQLRFSRIEKPYSVTLLDFKKEDYVGSDKPKHYESKVRVQDPRHDVDRTVSIWMNNPARYSGDTLYQAGFDQTAGDTTFLQVMTNSGWLAPYLACVIVGVGMFAHFVLTLARFVGRRDDEVRRTGGGDVAASFWPRRRVLADWKLPQVWVPLLLVAVLGGWAASRARSPRESVAEYHFSEFAALPAAHSGRVQPLDTLARDVLGAVSGKETYDDGRTDDDVERQPAIQWLLEAVSRRPGWQKHPVVRIENLEVLQTLGLSPRPGFRYSLAELMENDEEYERQIALARKARAKVDNESQLALAQVKFLELASKVQRVLTLVEAFGEQEVVGEDQATLLASLELHRRRIGSLNAAFAPRPLPPAEPDGAWQTMLEADFDALFARLRQQSQPNAPPQPERPGMAQLRGVLDAYAAENVGQFNARLIEYRTWLDKQATAEAEYEAGLAAAGERGTRKFVERLHPDRLSAEVAYNRLGLFTVSMAMYLTAFLLAAAAWMGWSEGFSRSSNWVLWLAFVLHTGALVARVYISGRPPVTSLYSSAVFIGWAAVLFALLFEAIYRLGVGNLLAAAIGFPSLIIASNLAEGDTFAVMQAVLDTQFWLATHVVCISLGYMATFLAGFLGVFWIVLGRVTRVFDDLILRQVTRMIYGTLCFAILFSFIGTVLGGLWADDSWGRFWGWDPKENGALMIVLWNALVLHARWGKLVGPRGLAVLAVFGNVVTAWSWFGVNQLGVGLHAYGFTSGVRDALIAFAVSQLIIMAAAAWPERRDDVPIELAAE